MKWKRNVVIRKDGTKTLLCIGEAQMEVMKNDQYLVDLLKSGMNDDRRLSECVMIHEHTNEMVAGFILAQFLLHYQDYIEEDKGYYEILP